MTIENRQPAIHSTIGDPSIANRHSPIRRSAIGTLHSAMAMRPTLSSPTLYIVPTDRWYIERAVWLIAGFVLLTSTTLAWLVDPRFIVFVAITGLTSVSVAFTGFCPVGNILYRFGLPALLADPSRPSFYFMRTDSWYLERRIYVTV